MYKVGTITFDILNCNNHQMLSGLNAFETATGIPDIIYEIVYVNDFKTINIDKCIFQNGNIIIEKTEFGYYWYYLFENCVYAVLEERCSHRYIYLKKDALDSTFHRYFLPSLFCLERLLLPVSSFILHSSYISFNHQGILFTAPSGFGKSTQADLWMKYKNAKILNGDKNIVGKENNNWYVYGTPFSGSSEYCVNQTTPLHAIIILEKGPENVITRMDIRGFHRVFSQVTVNPWDSDFCTKIMDLVITACSEVPVYLYSCTKEPSAVDDLYEVLIKDGVLHGTCE